MSCKSREQHKNTGEQSRNTGEQKLRVAIVLSRTKILVGKAEILMSRRCEQQKLRGGAMVLSRPEILVSRAVKPRLVWRQLDQQGWDEGRRHQHYLRAARGCCAAVTSVSWN